MKKNFSIAILFFCTALTLSATQPRTVADDNDLKVTYTMGTCGENSVVMWKAENLSDTERSVTFSISVDGAELGVVSVSVGAHSTVSASCDGEDSTHIIAVNEGISAVTITLQ